MSEIAYPSTPSSRVEPLAFAPPAVAVGQVVLWSYGPGERPSPAMVTAVGSGGTVSLQCHVDGVKDHVGKQGVRHRDDPWVRAHPSHDGGVWQLSPRDVEINRLLAEFRPALAVTEDD